MPHSPPVCIETDNVRYMLHWVGSRCIRITRHEVGTVPMDLRYDDLPEEVKYLIFTSEEKPVYEI